MEDDWSTAQKEFAVATTLDASTPTYWHYRGAPACSRMKPRHTWTLCHAAGLACHQLRSLDDAERFLKCASALGHRPADAALERILAERTASELLRLRGEADSLLQGRQVRSRSMACAREIRNC
jgi:hypothetical protein